MEQAVVTGKTLALDIKTRAHAVGKKVYEVLAEADVSIDTYKKWRSGVVEPRLRTVHKVYAIIKKYEAARAQPASDGGVCNSTE
jgi:predicted transcriptional regulator